MSTSLFILVNNLSEGLHNYKRIDYKSYLDYMSIKNDQLILKCLKCKKNYEKRFNNDLINRFASKYDSGNIDINKFILLVRKGVYPYE